MSTYAVGDIQGCYDPLRRLLDVTGFDPTHDELWAVGDFVNRGPDSLAVLRYLRDLGTSFRGVLGNHDLHLLAVLFGALELRKKDTLGSILEAHDATELRDWLRALPAAHYERGLLMVHAGVVPSWDLSQTLSRAEELHQVLRSDDPSWFFREMYGNRPDKFDESLAGPERLRSITNVLTRLRFCDADDRLDFDNKLGATHPPAGMLPWFAHPHRKLSSVPILFGHWAALRGAVDAPNLLALDTACVWGERLTAVRLEDGERFSCDCPKQSEQKATAGC